MTYRFLKRKTEEYDKLKQEIERLKELLKDHPELEEEIDILEKS
jgi:CHASE3 domain sensor protein